MNKLISKVYGPFLGGRAALGLLLLRVIVGAAFVMHGWPKAQQPFGWMGDKIPGIFQALAALAEFGGGLALIFGLLTPLAALGIAITMAVAYGMVHLPSGTPWLASKPGQNSFEGVAYYFISALTLLLTGPGKFSLDAILFNRKNR